MTNIAELLGAWKAFNQNTLVPALRRGNRIRTIQASLAVEQNRLTLEQVTAVLEGKTVLGSQREIQVVHMAPPASQIPRLMDNLLQWLGTTDAHPLIASAAFHYEFEFIHPFSDGNGRMGRLWQTPVKTPDRILSLLRDAPTLSIPQLASSLGKSDSAIERAIRKLREAGRLIRVGPDKGGHWQVLDENHTNLP